MHQCGGGDEDVHHLRPTMGAALHERSLQCLCGIAHRRKRVLEQRHRGERLHLGVELRHVPHRGADLQPLHQHRPKGGEWAVQVVEDGFADRGVASDAGIRGVVEDGLSQPA